MPTDLLLRFANVAPVARLRDLDARLGVGALQRLHLQVLKVCGRRVWSRVWRKNIRKHMPSSAFIFRFSKSAAQV
jgi:hypothetical protein